MHEKESQISNGEKKKKRVFLLTKKNKNQMSKYTKENYQNKNDWKKVELKKKTFFLK